MSSDLGDIWIDAQLPPALARWLVSDYGAKAKHVMELGLLQSPDRVIFERARAINAVVLTKDVDFVRLLERHGPPPRIVWVTAGNLTNPALRVLVDRHWRRIVELLLAGEELVELG